MGEDRWHLICVKGPLESVTMETTDQSPTIGLPSRRVCAGPSTNLALECTSDQPGTLLHPVQCVERSTIRVLVPPENSFAVLSDSSDFGRNASNKRPCGGVVADKAVGSHYRLCT